MTVSGLAKDDHDAQAELFTSGERAVKLRRALDDVRDKLGEASLVPAGTLRNMRHLSHVPFGAVSPRRPIHRARGMPNVETSRGA